MHRVKKVEHAGEYKLKLTFSDHTVKVVDLQSYLTKGVFLTLRDIDYFKKVSIQGHSIAWPNEADFCPDVLYEIGTPVISSLHRTRKKPKSPIAICRTPATSNHLD
jgi:hypothetical protein